MILCGKKSLKTIHLISSENFQFFITLINDQGFSIVNEIAVGRLKKGKLKIRVKIYVSFLLV